ncbi:NAD(P)(+) transhydrogenase (Re/Si-specific) subunit beta [Candidatus Paracaedibacter symbiosus]|uniref:NAD(P)(+) transhydrogenase (Re/Si-specific) subunit beta n=1 Tax=Candidatus Paracaedibacter symbiosus TaxID=244582 RepID=UPI0005096578|nr:NAD(P)(+) transhydrogenase (Re/Si-specific) subunit beta [Candidatus Paracaedibacter symbiosus]
MSANISAFFYLISAVCFIMALRGLSSAATSRTGNLYGVIGMTVAILTTLLLPDVSRYGIILVGIIIGGTIGGVIARKIKMTALPQLVAGFHSFVGLAAVLVAAAALNSPDTYKIGTAHHVHTSSLFEMGLGAAIGAITFSGSIIAFGKLQGLISGKPLIFPAQHKLNALLGLISLLLLLLFVTTGSQAVFWLLTLLAFGLGFLLIMPIGGADMPVVVSMLNSYSGWAAAGIGFTLGNNLLIITGALVGASGAILSYIMCKGMNRSIFNVILGGFGTDSSGGGASPGSVHDSDRPVKVSSAEDAAFMLGNARSVIIVPGYGMAVAQAQHSLREMADLLKKQGIKVRYAIHPVAGRMPGHMNVLLAEANVPYDEVLELEEINNDFSSADVAFVIGANDITNPAAKTDPSSPIYGMPILDVEKAKTVFFVKRSLASGYAGVDNELFYHDNTFMVLGDAKKVCDDIVKSINHS